MPFRLLVVVLAALALPLSLPADEARMLRIHWEPSKTYTLENLTENTLQKPGDSANAQVIKVTQTTLMTVKKDPASTDRLVTVKFVAVRGLMGSGDNLVTFDSNKPNIANPMLEKAMARAVGKTFTLVYDDQDRFRDVRDLRSMASDPGSVTGLSALADSRDVANLFRKSMEIGLPPIAVNVGETWTADETMTFPKAGDTHVEMNGKFEAIEERDGRKHAKIVFEGKLSSVERKDKPVANVEIGPGSTMSGVVFFDLERRITTLSTCTNHLNMIVAGQEMPFEQRITSRLSEGQDGK